MLLFTISFIFLLFLIFKKRFSSGIFNTKNRCKGEHIFLKKNILKFKNSIEDYLRRIKTSSNKRKFWTKRFSWKIITFLEKNEFKNFDHVKWSKIYLIQSNVTDLHKVCIEGSFNSPVPAGLTKRFYQKDSIDFNLLFFEYTK